MTFVLENRWVWDFWIARDGADYHLFFLQADRALGDPELRHWNVSIGHAISTDLWDWRYLGNCFYPSAAPAWDDGTTWTGCVVKHQSVWHLFYTGTSRAEGRKKQRIGLATSTDLHHWTRHPLNPIVDLDRRFYEEFDPAVWHDRSLRDPWVAPDPSGTGFRMWFTARAKAGVADGRGVIGTAHSSDLKHWNVESPVTAGGDFGEVEVPQYLTIGGRHYLLFCTSAKHTSALRKAELAKRGLTPETGTHYFVADHPQGPWRLGPLPFLCGPDFGDLYAGRIIDDANGNPKFLGFVGTGADGKFQGTISDPIGVIVGADGRLTLESPQPSEERELSMPVLGMAAAK
jgi:beta-fructofuranosidase